MADIKIDLDAEGSRWKLLKKIMFTEAKELRKRGGVLLSDDPEEAKQQELELQEIQLRKIAKAEKNLNKAIAKLKKVGEKKIVIERLKITSKKISKKTVNLIKEISKDSKE